MVWGQLFLVCSQLIVIFGRDSDISVVKATWPLFLTVFPASSAMCVLRVLVSRCGVFVRVSRSARVFIFVISFARARPTVWWASCVSRVWRVLQKLCSGVASLFVGSRQAGRHNVLVQESSRTIETRPKRKKIRSSRKVAAVFNQFIFIRGYSVCDLSLCFPT